MRPYLIFTLSFVVTGVVFSFLAAIPEAGWLSTANAFLAPIAAALAGVLIAQRSGHLALIWLLTIGLVLSAAMYVATWGGLHYLALPAGDSVPFWRLAQVGGWPYMLSCLSLAVAPVIGRLLVPRPNNSVRSFPSTPAAR